MKAQAKDFLTDSERDEQESSEDTAWGDNFIQIHGDADISNAAVSLTVAIAFS